MDRKNIVLLSFVAVLGAVYAVYFSGGFAPKTFKVSHTFRNLRPFADRPGILSSLIFVANRELKLTELKVVPLAEWQTNKDAHPLWHLVTESNSLPVKRFFYGQPIPGLHPFLKGVRAEIPPTNVVCRLFITAGAFKAEHDFELK